MTILESPNFTVFKEWFIYMELHSCLWYIFICFFGLGDHLYKRVLTHTPDPTHTPALRSFLFAAFVGGGGKFEGEINPQN